MTSQIRVDEITNRSGLGTVTIYDNGFEFTGVTTFTENVDIEGNLTIGGVLTYEDTTNIDSVGVITARAGVHVTGGNLAVGHNNPSVNLHVKGSASNGQIYLGGTGAHSQIYADNDGVLILNADQGNSAANSYLGFNVDNTERLRIASDGKLSITGSTANMEYLRMGGNNDRGLRFSSSTGSSSVGVVHTINAPGDNGSQGTIVLQTNSAERLRIQPSGYIGIGEAAPGGKLTVKHANTATSGLNATLKLKQGVATNGNRSSLIFSSLDDFDVAAVNGVVENHAGQSANNVGRLEFWTKASGSDVAERLRITSDGKVGINETSPTARLDINHPNTEQGLVVRSRYGNINTAMVKFDADPDSDGGDGNVLHLHGGSSRTDSEILHVNSTGEGTCFQIRGDGRTRVYKQLQLEHASNVPKIIFNEYGANDIKAQIEMDQVSGSAGQLIFRTQDSGTLSERLRITSDGKTGIGGITPQNLLNVNATGSMGLYGTTAGKTGHSIKFIRKYGSSATHNFAVINGASPHGQSRLGGFVATYTFRSAYGFDSDGGGHGVRMLSGRVRDSGEWGFDQETSYGTGDSPRPTLQGVDNNNGTCTLQVVNPGSTHSYGEFHIVAWDCQITTPTT